MHFATVQPFLSVIYAAATQLKEKGQEAHKYSLNLVVGPAVGNIGNGVKTLQPNTPMRLIRWLGWSV